MSNSDPQDETAAASRRQRVATRTAEELVHRLSEPLHGGLYLVATPIGNLADVTLRALVVMTAADRLYCEDTRQSLKLLQRFGIERRLDIYHEHNAERERPRVLAALSAGQSVALISDAGTPLVSDPGYKLVRDVIEAGHEVHAIPGPSAVLAGLVASGLPTDAFHFAGFLPSRGGPRSTRIAELAPIPGTLIFFESPSRLAEALSDLAAGLGHRPAVVARELTKLNETCYRGSLAELAAWAAADPVKGECVVLVGPAGRQEIDDAAIEAALEQALDSASVRDAAAGVAGRLGVPRRRVYDLAIAMSERRRSSDAGDR